MPSAMSDPTSMMMCPDRRFASTSVPYSQTVKVRWGLVPTNALLLSYSWIVGNTEVVA